MANYISNPVGTLQERFQSHGMKPHYKLVKASGSAHDPTFSCQVTVRNQVCMGSGSSKKQAKNAAALAMLDKLDKMFPANGKTRDRLDDSVPVNEKTARQNMMVPAVVQANVKSKTRLDHIVPANENTQAMQNKMVSANETSQTRLDHTAAANENNQNKDSVGILNKMCENLGYRHPEYDLEGLDGQPQVGISILCSVGDLKQRGTGPSKDEAKMEAAQKMVDMLSSLMPNSLSVIPSSGKSHQEELSDKMDSLNIVTSMVDVNRTSNKVVNNGTSEINIMASKMMENSSCRKLRNNVSSDMNTMSSNMVNNGSSDMNIMSSNLVNNGSSDMNIISSNMANDNNVSSKIMKSFNTQLSPSAKLDSLHKTCLKERARDYITMLAELGKEQRLVVTHVEERSDDCIQCLVQLSTVPVAVSYAKGTDSETIHNEAARDMLIYLKMLTKQSN